MREKLSALEQARQEGQDLIGELTAWARERGWRGDDNDPRLGWRDRLEAAARIVGRLAQAQEMMVLADSPYCGLERLREAFDEIYDRLRAEAEKEGK